MMNFDLSIQRFDQFADEYAQRFMDLKDYADSIERFCDWIGKPEPNILELACGPGNVTRMLKIRFPESKITAIDLAPQMIEIARKHLPDIDFRVMDVRNISAIPELIEDTITGILIPEKNEQAIADAILKLINDPALYISISMNAQKKVTQKFNLNDSTTKIIHLFRNYEKN